jgi:predicted transcriptional regulator
MIIEPNREVLLNQTTQIVSSHLSKSPISQESIPSLIRQVFDTLNNLGKSAQHTASASTPAKDAASDEAPDGLVPAVPIKKSVFPDHIVCLEDGKRLKMLKRHLMSAYGMTPDQYRQRWGLPPEYPMVAPNYSQQRSMTAKNIGLGQKRASNEEAEAEAEPEVVETTEEVAAAPTPRIRRFPEAKRGPGRPRRSAAA